MCKETSSTGWATVHKLAVETNSPDRYVQKWLAAGEVPSRKLGTRTLYQREHALATIRVHQRSRKSGPEVGLAALSESITSLRRLADTRAAMLEVLRERVREIVETIVANCPTGEVPDVPAQPPQFSRSQAAWIASQLNPLGDLNLLPSN
jgi:hypothetical protein